MRDQPPRVNEHERSGQPPRIPYEELLVPVTVYLGDLAPVDISAFIDTPTGIEATLPVTLRAMHRDHPSVAQRLADISGRINQGLGGTNSSLVPDVKNFQNCAIVAYGLMRHAYGVTGRQLPQDCEQHPWFEQPQMVSIDNVFDGMNMAQLTFTEQYRAMAAALREFVHFSGSNHNTHYDVGLATLAGAEVFDSFFQMEQAS